MGKKISRYFQNFFYLVFKFFFISRISRITWSLNLFSFVSIAVLKDLKLLFLLS